MLKTKYASLDAIPVWAKDLYTQVGSEWVLKTDAIEGAAEYFNPGLAQNRDNFRTEKEALAAQLSQANNRAANAEAQLARVSTPGSLVLNSEQAKLWQRYEGLGKPTDLETIKKEHGEFSGQLSQFRLMADLETVAKDTGLNADALKAEMPLRFPGLKLVSRQIDVVENGKTVKKNVAVAQITQQVNGVNQLTEQPFIQYAKDNRVPDYVLNAIQAQPAGGQQNNGQPIINGNNGANIGNGQPVIRPLVPVTGAANPLGNMSGQQGGGVVIDTAALLAQSNASRGVVAPVVNNGQASTGGAGQ